MCPDHKFWRHFWSGRTTFGRQNCMVQHFVISHSPCQCKLAVQRRPLFLSRDIIKLSKKIYACNGNLNQIYLAIAMDSLDEFPCTHTTNKYEKHAFSRSMPIIVSVWRCCLSISSRMVSCKATSLSDSNDAISQ